MSIFIHTFLGVIIIVMCLFAILVNLVLLRKQPKRFERYYTIAVMLYVITLYVLQITGFLGDQLPPYLARPMNILLIGVIIAKV